MARPLDPYRTLELPRDATLDDVKAAYRRLAKLYHPDSAGERALPRFLAVQAAYEALTEGPGKLRAVIGGRPRPTTPSTARTSSGRTGRPAADPWSGRSTGPGPRPWRGPADARSAPGSRAGSRPGSGGGGAAGVGGAASSASGDGAASGRAGSSRTRGPAGPRARRTRRPPGSTSYDGADSEPFEPEWQGASWYGGSSGTYWTINPREYADPRKHGPEYLARGADNGRGTPRSRRPRAGDGRAGAGRAGAPPREGAAGAAEAATAGLAGAPDESFEPGDGRGFTDAGSRPAATTGPGPWPAARANRSDVSALGLIAAALLALALVAVLFALMAAPGAPGAASVVPVVAFCGVAIAALVRVLRREGRPGA